jgi:hypothetical protein
MVARGAGVALWPVSLITRRFHVLVHIAWPLVSATWLSARQ